MKRQLGLVWVPFLVIGLVPAGLGKPHSAVAATKALYSWKLPVKGQVGLWTVSKRVLAYQGDQNDAVFAPYKLRGTNFAIQAQIKNNGPSGIATNLPGYGLVVRTRISDPHTSVVGGSYFSDNGEDINPELYWNGQTVGGTAFDPKSSWHLYRLEVQGDQYTLLIDGKKMVQYTIPDYPHPTRVGVFSTYYKIQVRNFRIEAMGAATSHVTTAPELRRFNLTLADLPTDGYFDSYLSHWFTNEEAARIRNVSLDSLVTRGRIIAYETDFYVLSPEYTDVYCSVTAFTSPAGAQADMSDRLIHFRQVYSTDPQFKNYRDLGGLGIGDSSGGFSFEYTVAGLHIRTVVIYVQRGRYVTTLRIPFYASFPIDQNLAISTSLAKIIDARIQQG